MATGLKRDPIVLLRLDGHDLLDFINGASYEAEMVPIFTQVQSSSDTPQARHHIISALGKLTVDHGVPPTSDPWVMRNIVEPAIESCKVDEMRDEEKVLAEFRRVAQNIAQHLKEQPVIVAHSENSFDGSGIRRLLSNKFELDKTLEAAMENIARDGDGEMKWCKEELVVVLDSVVAPYAVLPPVGAIQEMDKIAEEAVAMMNEGKMMIMVKDEELKKMIIQVLGSIMVQLEGNPVLVSTNSVVHEPLVSSSSLLHPSTNN